MIGFDVVKMACLQIMKNSASSEFHVLNGICFL
jgi:hypothetical protein